MAMDWHWATPIQRGGPGGHCYKHRDCRANRELAAACCRQAFLDLLRELPAGKRVRFNLLDPERMLVDDLVGIVISHDWQPDTVGSHVVTVRPDPTLSPGMAKT